MFTAKQMDLLYGMAVTASHNPAIYNGIKIFTASERIICRFSGTGLPSASDASLTTRIVKYT